jgi:TolB protein
MPFDGVQFDTTAIVQLTNGGRNFFPSWSPDGEWIAYDSNYESSTGYFIWKMRRDGSSKRRIAYTPDDGETREPFWGNDFSIVHYRYIGIGSPEIFKMDSSGNNVVRLTENNAMEKYPRSSPDNQFIAYVSESKSGLWRLDLFSNEVNLLTEGCLNFSWSPDGKIVYLNFDYSRIDEEKGTLWIMDSDGNNKRQFTYNHFKIIQ